MTNVIISLDARDGEQDNEGNISEWIINFRVQTETVKNGHGLVGLTALAPMGTTYRVCNKAEYITIY